MSQPIHIERGDLSAISEQIAAELRTVSALQGVTVLVADPVELAYEIDKVVAQAKGLVVLVESPTGNNTKPAVFSALRFDDVTLAVTVTEDPTANRAATGTGLHALRVLAEAMRRLHGYRPAAATQMLSCRGFTRLEDDSLLVYRSTFGTAISLGSDADLRERAAT
jgi:hypothetical protein